MADLNLHPIQDISLAPEHKDTPTAETPKVVIDTHNLIEAAVENENKVQMEKEKGKRHSLKHEEGKDASPRGKEKGTSVTNDNCFFPSSSYIW